MEVRVEYFAQIKKTIGKAHEWVSLTSPPVLDHLLRLLYERNSPEFRSIVFDEKGNVLPSVMISLNYEQIEHGCAWPLKQGDTVSILSPMSGG